MLTLGGKFEVAMVAGIAVFSFSGSFVMGVVLEGEAKLDVSKTSDALVCRLT
jgi:hypothetical protein